MAQDNLTQQTPSLRPSRISYQELAQEIASHSNVQTAIDEVNRMTRQINAALNSRPPALHGNLNDRLRESIQQSDTGKTLTHSLMTASIANRPEPKPMDQLSPEEYYQHVSNVNQQMNVLLRLATTAQGLTMNALANVANRFNQAMYNQSIASSVRQQQIKQSQQLNNDPNSELGQLFILQNGGSTGLTMQAFEGQQGAIADSISLQMQEEQVEEEQHENMVTAINVNAEELQVEALEINQTHQHVAEPHPGSHKLEEKELRREIEHDLEKHQSQDARHLGRHELHKLEESVEKHEHKIEKMMHEIGKGDFKNAMEDAKDDVQMFEKAEKAIEAMMKLTR